MRGIGYITIIVVMIIFTTTMCTSCPSGVGIGTTNYEQHGVYYNGKYLSGVTDDRFLPLMRLIGTANPKETKSIQAAWNEHNRSVTKVPRKFTIQLWPEYTICVVGSVDDKNITPTASPLVNKTVGDKTVAQYEIILPQTGRYIIGYSGRFILLQY